MSRVYLLSLSFASVSLSAPASLSFDPNEVRPWSKTEKDQFPTPLGAVFKKGNKTLIFVGDHHAEPASTYKLVEFAFKKFQPQIVIVESLDFSLGENPEKHLKKYKSKTKEQVLRDPSLAPGAGCFAISSKEFT